MCNSAEPPVSFAKFRLFDSLRSRDFRLLWTGLSISAVGTWMQIVAQSLLVLDLTHGSAVALGTVALSQAAAFLLFALFGGGVADRLGKRKLLLCTQCFLMLVATGLGILTALSLVRFWMVLLAAFAGGAALSFDQPARNALIADLVPKDSLMNAIALQSTVFNGAALLGPALAGFALPRIGYAGAFFLNALSFVAVLGALVLLKQPTSSSIVRPAGRLLESVREALTYVRHDAVLPWVIVAYGTLLFCGPSTALVLPLFTRDVLHTGATDLGFLFSSGGAGTVASAFLIASLGNIAHKGQLLLWSMLIWAVALVIFGMSATIGPAAIALFILGFAQAGVSTASVTLLQMRVPPEMRGRAMSLNTLLIMCVRPLGDFPAGALISWIGLRTTIVAAAAAVAITVTALSATQRSLRNA